MSFTAKDVASLRATTGAGMMDCKKALEENGGDIEASKQWLREKGLAASAKRDDRESAQGVVAVKVTGNVAAIVKLKCETDFVAGSEQFIAEAEALADLVIAKGEAAVSERNQQLEDLKILLKEKIDLGDVVRFEAASGCSNSHTQRTTSSPLLRSLASPPSCVIRRLRSDSCRFRTWLHTQRLVGIELFLSFRVRH